MKKAEKNELVDQQVKLFKEALKFVEKTGAKLLTSDNPKDCIWPTPYALIQYVSLMIEQEVHIYQLANEVIEENGGGDALDQ